MHALRYRDPVTNTDIVGAFDGNPYFSRWEDVPNYFRCNDLTETEPGISQIQPQAEVSVIFWVLFTFVSAFVMLSLFVGAVTLAMSDSMDPDKDEVIMPCTGATCLKEPMCMGLLFRQSSILTSMSVHCQGGHIRGGILPRLAEPPRTAPPRTTPHRAA